MKIAIHSKSLAKRFTTIFTNLGNLTESVVLYFNDDGLYIQGIDTGHVSLYEANFDKTWFSVYKRAEDDAAQISISLDYFKRILSTRGDDQIIYLECNGLSPDKMTIIFRSIAKESKEFPREYEMNLMDIDTEAIEVPEKEDSVQFYIESKTMTSLVKQLMMFDETVIINCNEEEINFRSKGTEGSMSVNLFDNDKDYVEEFMIDEDYQLKISFALRYLEHFCAFQKVAPRMRLSLTNSLPIELFYSLETPPKNVKHDKNGEEDGKKEDAEYANDHENPNSYLRFFLAPKVEDDDDEEEQ